MAVDRIVIDGLNLALRHGTGIATYGLNLTRLLRKLGFEVDVLYDRQVVTGANRPREEGHFGAAPPPSRGSRLARNLVAALPWMAAVVSGVHPITVSEDPTLHGMEMPGHPDGTGILAATDLFRRASASAKLLRRPLDVKLSRSSALHLTSPLPLLALHAPTIVTVHDVIPLRLPETVVDAGSRFRRQVRVAAQSATHIITVSESTKRDLLAVIPLPEEKISVVYQPLHPIPRADTDAAPHLVEAVYGLTPDEYFLFLGAIEPKKNLPRLAEAFLLSGTTAPLVVAGPDGWMVEQQLAPVRQYQEQQGIASPCPTGDRTRGERFRRLGYLPRSHVIALLSQARALLFASLYEGFGLPAVEAMQLGVPVLAGSLGALPEIAGDAALLVDPFDTKAIAQAIRQLDNDATLRAELRRAGPPNAARFSDAACLAMLATAYGKAGIEVPGNRDPSREAR